MRIITSTRAPSLTPAENVLMRLERVRQRQPGQWSARCPSHPDKAPSLSVRETPEGALLLRCFAGCEVDAVVNAIGLEMHDLFPPSVISKTAPKRIARLLTPGQAFDILYDDTQFLAVFYGSRLNGAPVTDADWELARGATGRIAAIHTAVHS